MPQFKRGESQRLFEEALTFFPGGVNSPVRAFKGVGGTPLFIKKGKGSVIWDEDDNSYIDFCNSWGPLIHGHANNFVNDKIIETLQMGSSFGAPTKKENELAKLIKHNIPFIGKMRFVSSGTEAVMSAIRLARGATGKSKIIKFEGCYHGHFDSMLVKAGSGLATLGTSTSAGVPESFAADTLVLPLNDEIALRETMQKYANELAAVIIEPIPANNGLLLQDQVFLKNVRNLCSEFGVLLIFDEVISGFRVAFGGASELYELIPDIVTYGKIIGGGLPVGAYAASEELMNWIAPDGPVYQAGTLSGNPVAMAAGLAQLEICLEKGFYDEMELKTKRMVNRINEYANNHNYPFEMISVGSIFWLSFNGRKSIKKSDEINPDMSDFNQMHAFLLKNGVYLGPSGYEVGFISSAHSQEDLTVAVNLFCQGLDTIYGRKS